MADRDGNRLANLLDRVRDAALAVESTTVLTPVGRALASAKAPTVNEFYDRLVSDAILRRATRKLFHDGHYAEAVRKAFVVVNSEVKRRASNTRDGIDLMNQVFGTSTPALRLNDGATQSERDEQEGYRFIFAGVMTGIRNPRSHESVEDAPESALEMLVLANHLLRVLDRARVPRDASERSAKRGEEEKQEGVSRGPVPPPSHRPRAKRGAGKSP